MQLRPEMRERYIQYTPHIKIRERRAEWFYVENHSPALPDRVPGPPQMRSEWFTGGELDRIENLKKSRVTGGSVVLSWIGCRIQSL